MKLFIELTIAIALTFGAILASSSGAFANDISVIAAFARASATSGAKSGAAYVSFQNTSAKADRLLSVTSPQASMVMLHQTNTNVGISTMAAAEQETIPANAAFTMQPGGYHLMLMGLSQPLEQGKSLELIMTFENAGPMRVTVPIAGIAAMAPGN